MTQLIGKGRGDVKGKDPATQWLGVFTERVVDSAETGLTVEKHAARVVRVLEVKGAMNLLREINAPQIAVLIRPIQGCNRIDLLVT